MQIIFLSGDGPLLRYPNQYAVTPSLKKCYTHNLKNGDDPD